MDIHIFRLNIQTDSSVQLQKQVYFGLRELILAGDLLPGVRLPPSRKLADHLGVSRKTVVHAYDQLIAEGYLTSQTGSGTFVSPNLPETEIAEDYVEEADEEPRKPVSRSVQIKQSLSFYGKKLGSVDLLPPRMERMRFPFFSWQPAFDEIPWTEWARIVSKTFRRSDAFLVDYATDPLGHRPLREAIAERLARTRGLHCQADQIVITCGLSQSLDLIARLHAEGGELLVENPSYRAARDIFQTYGARVRSIDVDPGGLKTERLSKLSRHNVKVIYVTPSHQFPTGAVLSLSRRLELLKWATECGALVIEDDFDSEFRYRGSPIPAMKTLDKEENVIYMSTFTKIFYPSLAIAYMVLPPPLIPIYTRARWLAADQISLQLQEALAEFISTGLLERHVKRMRATYATRRKALVAAIEEHLEGYATTHGDHAGLSALIRLKSKLDDDEIMRRANTKGIALTSTRLSYTRNPVQGEFILGYGNLGEEEIIEGIKALRQILAV